MSLIIWSTSCRSISAPSSTASLKLFSSKCCMITVMCYASSITSSIFTVYLSSRHAFRTSISRLILSIARVLEVLERVLSTNFSLVSRCSTTLLSPTTHRRSILCSNLYYCSRWGCSFYFSKIKLIASFISASVQKFRQRNCLPRLIIIWKSIAYDELLSSISSSSMWRLTTCNLWRS